jgi:hypothetical protein
MGELLPFLFGRLRAWGDMPHILRHRRRLQFRTNGASAAQCGVEPRFWD